DGKWLCLAANLPEPGGKILARAFGRNPVWQMDSYRSPAVEDRVEYRFSNGSGGVERKGTVTINPWGAYTIERDGKITHGAELEEAALVTASGWTLEAALPLSWFGLERTAGTTGIRLQTVRIRSRRPLAPEFRWYWPGAQSAGTMQL